jgi:glycosyltransferase involved in cell wall biosynthesis
MTAGLKGNGAEVICVTAPPFSRKNQKNIFVKLSDNVESGVRFAYVPFLNLPIIKNFSVYKNTKKRCLELLKESEKKGEKAGIVLDLLCISSCAGALSALKTFNKKTGCSYFSAGIVTDLPQFLSHGGGLLEKLFKRSFDRSLKDCSSYVFLTEQMNTLLNKESKPYTVIEGQADENTPCPTRDVPKKHICMYAGSLAKIYGIMTLAEAFKELVEENLNDTQLSAAELHIYGNGDCREELIALADRCNSVKYCGILSPEEIVAKEQEATLLINPRPTDEEYTKYSFPSKNMEYMASGTAVLTTDLPGMPSEYKEYVYIIKNETKDGIKETLKNLLKQEPQSLYEKGLAARNFVLTQKNSKIQSGKVLELLK